MVYCLIYILATFRLLAETSTIVALKKNLKVHGKVWWIQNKIFNFYIGFDSYGCINNWVTCKAVIYCAYNGIIYNSPVIIIWTGN